MVPPFFTFLIEEKTLYYKTHIPLNCIIMDKVPAYALFLGALASLVYFLLVDNDLLFIGVSLIFAGLGCFFLKMPTSPKVNCTIRYEKWNVIYGNQEECIEFTFDETKTHLN